MGSQAVSRDAGAAWTAVGFLAVFFVISYVDRLVLSLLVEPIKADLGVTDTQVGLLIGTSFAICYTLFGLPIARLADSANRAKLIFAGVLLWNLMTAASAFAPSFETLILLRIGVALGEAVLVPPALSMIADLFTRERRSFPTSVFLGVGAIGGGGALIVGAAGLQLVTTSWVRHLPLVGDMEPWRLTLLFLGAPGLVIAVLFALLVREPRRVDHTPGRRASIPQVFQHVRGNFGAYAGVFGVSALVSMLSMSVLAWYPTHLVRNYAMSPTQAGYTFGVVAMVTTLLGGVLVSATADRLNRNGRYDGFTWAALFSIVLLAPLLIISLSSPTATLSLLFAAPAFLIMLGLGIMCTVTVPLLSPGPLRAQAAALYLLVVNLIGLGLGPVLVAILSDHVFHEADGLGRSIVGLVCIVAPLEIVLLLASRRSLSRSLREASEHEAGVLVSASI